MLYANSPVPLYRQLYVKLRDEIEAQRLPLGGRLPSERELAAEYGISRLTARRALQLLQQAGFINAQQGRGSFVVSMRARSEHRLPEFSEAVSRQGLAPFSRLLRCEVVEAEADLAAQLELPAQARVILLRRLRLADSRPIAINTTYLPFDLCHEILTFDLEAESLYAILENHLGFHLSHLPQTTEAILAAEDDLKLLGLPYPMALLLLRRRTYNEQGRIVEYTEILCRGEQLRSDFDPGRE